ncbi:hypothetical protein AALP_AAs50253U000600 [Arabis alpina]|uniref:Protein kinase domain-containing protein n=1 Tax=Arabis alpina TaxID=50452 RepID=A0A087G2P8_ARAAL|nr:hypothetical protein AALP_AAs50253U000600 [Arabis alpina]
MRCNTRNTLWSRETQTSLRLANKEQDTHRDYEMISLSTRRIEVKATNMLLGQSLNAKISDFGLAKLNNEENTYISTRIAGTI